MHLNTPCPHFPSCGGCDFLDLPDENYHQIKQDFLKNLFAKSIAIEPEWIWVGPHSRRKVIFQIDHKNHLGFFGKKTNDLVEINSCFIAEKNISDLILDLKNFLEKFEQGIITQISTTLFDNGLDLIFSLKREPNFSHIQKLTEFGKTKNLNISYKISNNVTPIFIVRKNEIFYPEFKIKLDSEIFIQATKSGLESIIKICQAEIKTGEKIIDIYSGFGAYTFAIANLSEKIFAVEGSQKMVDLINGNAASNNLSHKIKAETRDLFSYPISAKELSKFDIAIINPPRNGASPQAMEIAKSNLQKIIYVSCNPQTFLRDAKILIDSNYKITKLYALDQFYSSKHLEIIGIFEKKIL